MPIRIGDRCYNEVMGQIVEVPCATPGTQLPGDGGDPCASTDIIEQWLCQQQREEEETGGPTSTTTDRTVTGEETTQRTGTQRITGDETIRQTVRRYIDIPTPEEVLNDFETGLSAYVGALVEGGVLNPNDANIALTELMPNFLNDYMAELGQRAARGENIFRVVGLGEPTRVGTRPGEQTTTERTGTEKATGEETTETTGRTTVGETTTQDGESAQGTATTTEDTTRKEKTETTTERDETQRFEQEEEVFERPRLTSVYSLSPAAFLMQRFGGAEGLAVAVRSKKGERQRLAQTATGGEVVSARRA